MDPESASTRCCAGSEEITNTDQIMDAFAKSCRSHGSHLVTEPGRIDHPCQSYIISRSAICQTYGFLGSHFHYVCLPCIGEPTLRFVPGGWYLTCFTRYSNNNALRRRQSVHGHRSRFEERKPVDKKGKLVRHYMTYVTIRRTEAAPAIDYDALRHVRCSEPTTWHQI